MTNSETTLRTFDFAGLELRVVMHMGEPLFLLADVCKVLDLRSNNGSYTHHLRKLSAHQFTSTSNVEVSGLGIRGVPKLVTEAGLYKLISRSRKPEAIQFQDWVFGDVLPAIRKTGGYLLDEEARETAKADDRQARNVLGQKSEAVRSRHQPRISPLGGLLSTQAGNIGESPANPPPHTA